MKTRIGAGDAGDFLWAAGVVVTGLGLIKLIRSRDLNSPAGAVTAISLLIAILGRPR